MSYPYEADFAAANADYPGATCVRSTETNVAPDTKPLEDISRIADNLQRQADALDEYLERFNGPRPAQLAKGETNEAPRCYRSEIDRLDNLVRRIGSITDLITRIG